jgi:hypothetical protein
MAREICRSLPVAVEPERRNAHSWHYASSHMRVVGFVVAALVGVWFAVEEIRYLAHDAYLDHIEGGNVVVIVTSWLSGTAPYGRAITAPWAPYGPALYLVEAAAVALSPTILATKIPPALAFVAAAAFALARFRKEPWSLALLAGALLLFNPTPIWARSDPFSLAVATAAIAALATKRAPLWIGICGGVLFALKADAACAIVPPAVALLVDERRMRRFAVMTLAGAASFLAWFAAPNISLVDYAHGLAGLGRSRALSHEILADVVVDVAALWLPIVALAIARRPKLARADVAFLASAAAISALLVVPSSFPGSGAYHVLPMAPIFAEALRRVLHADARATTTTTTTMTTSFLTRRLDVVAFVSLVPLLALGAHSPNQVAIIARLDALEGEAAFARDALAFANENQGHDVQMAFGATRYQATQTARALLALNGHAPSVDAQALMEAKASGVDATKDLLPLVEGCAVAAWLVPIGDAPFSITSFYDDEPVFPRSFEDAFLAKHRRYGRTEQLDIWVCR